MDLVTEGDTSRIAEVKIATAEQQFTTCTQITSSSTTKNVSQTFDQPTGTGSRFVVVYNTCTRCNKIIILQCKVIYFALHFLKCVVCISIALYLNIRQ